MKRNKFSKALKHLKSTELDEKLRSLEEAAPVNSMSGVYSLNQPGQRIGHYDKDPAKKFYPDVDGNWPSGIPGTPGERVYERPPGYWDGGPGSVPPVEWDDVQEADMSHSGTDTNGFIDSQTGRVLTDLPPNSSHFILGPLVDGYTYNHGYDDFTRIGYLQKDTRQFVLLAQIPGYWQSGVSGIDQNFNTNRQWNGSTITIYNSNFTLEMAQWFRDRYNESKYVKNVSYFYSGGYPQSSNPDPNAPAGSRAGAVAGVGNGEDANSNAALPHGSGTSNGDPNIGTHQNAPNHGGPEDAKIYNPQDPRNKFPQTVDPKDPSTWPPEERAAMSAEDLANLGLNLLNIGLDIAAVAAIIFPEPGTSAAGLARLATRVGSRVGSRAMNSARNRALRGALNPLGQRAVRSGAAGRQRIPVYTGRSGFGPMRNAPGKTVYGSPDRGVAGSYARSNQALKGAGSTPQGGTVYRGTLPQRYVDKYGSRNVFGQRQVKMSKSAADKAFKKATGLKEWIAFLMENEAAPTAAPTTYYDAQLGSDNTVTDFKTSFRNTSSGLQEITPEQEEKVNQTADQLADNVDLPEEDLGNLAVETEELAVQEETKQLTPQELVNEWNEMIDSLPDWNMSMEDLKPHMSSMYSTAEKISILNHSSIETQEQFLNALGFTDMGLLRNFSDENFRKIVSDSTLGYSIIPGGTPTTGWDGKFYSWGDPELEKSRIVSQEEYRAAKLRPDFYGLETPDIAESGYRYTVKPPTWTGGQPSYEYTGVSYDIAKNVEAPNKRITGPIWGATGYGLGIGWDLSIYNGTIDPALKGYESALERAVVKATNMLNQLDTKNLSNLVLERVSDLQRYSGIYGGEGKLNQLTDETWNLYAFAFGSGTEEEFNQLLSISGPSALYNPSAEYYGSAEALARAKRDAEKVWSEWSKYKEFAQSLKTLNWKDYDSDEWYGEGEKSKRHPLLGPDPEPEPPRDGYDYYPEFDDIEDVMKDFPDEDVQMTIEDLGAAGYAAYKAGGGDAKVKEGFSVAEVIKQGQINLNAFLPGGPVQKPIRNPEKDTPNLLRNLTQTITDLLPPASKYKTNIAVSILKNEPIQNVASPRDIKLFVNGLNPYSFGNDEYSSFPITEAPVPYADENIRERPDGTVEANPDPSTNNTGPVYNFTEKEKSQAGYANPLAAAGQAQVQLVVPDGDPRNAYVRYVDHAYLNINSADPGEIPKGDFLSGPIAALLGGPERQHTGGFRGYPPNIKGDQVTKFDVSYDDLPPKFQEYIRYHIEQNDIRLRDYGLSTTDAATAAYERKKKEEEERRKGQKEQFSPPKVEVLSESRRRILREIKQPYKLPEQGKQKYKMNFKGKFRPQNTPDVTASKQTESMLKAKNAAGQTWRAQDKHWSRYESTERMNVIYDNVRHGSQYFDMIVNENQGKKGWRNREIQEQLNLIAHERAMRQMDSNYESPFNNEIVEQETMQYDNDPLFKKVANRLKKEIDYPNKPSKAGYPDTPPPSEDQLVNGQHPEHGQRHPYYTKLDPHSADAMPVTDNPKIDAEVSKAKRLKKILGKAPSKANPPKGS